MTTDNFDMQYNDSLQTPLGRLTIQADQDAIKAIEFDMDEMNAGPGNAVTEEAKNQLEAYFSGRLCVFDLPLAPEGTGFQQRVWQALTTLHYGQTASYQTIANMLSNPKAVRAVGAANGHNPIAIVIPCHRVIGANGSLTGYAGGLERKKWLLELESQQRELAL